MSHKQVMNDSTDKLYYDNMNQICTREVILLIHA